MVERATMLTEARRPELPEWLHELYPFHTRTLQLGSFKMSFVDEAPLEASGAVESVILLHGNPAWSFLYRDLIQRLRPQYRVVAPDMIGFGLSDKPNLPAYHTLAQHISNFSNLVEALDLRNFTLVANGWGGPIGLGYAVTCPRNVSRLVLANTWAANLPLPARKRARLPLGMRIAASGRLGQWLDAALNLSMNSVFSSRMYRSIGDLVLEAYSYPFAHRAPRVAIGAFTRMFFDPDQETMAKLAEIQAGLKNITAPADILWGAHDPVLSKLPAYLLRDDLSNAREPVLVPEVSHYLPEEAPELLAATVLRRTGQAANRDSGGNLFKIVS